MAGIGHRLAASGVLTIALTAAVSAQETGNVIFFHPDGTGVNHSGAARMHTVGPDGELNWDQPPALGVDTGHTKDQLTSTSHGGATMHAYGVKVVADSFGLDGEAPITAASGEQQPIAEEAMAAGKAVGLISPATSPSQEPPRSSPPHRPAPTPT